jgi:two-component system, cell cycle sensor histidine kinase and response regulator CckA
VTSTRQRPIEILLVEDSHSDRLIATEALTRARLMNNLHWVDDGVEALDFLRRAGKFADAPMPDLVLLDLNLPRKDGREVLAEMKQDPGLRLIPVVVMTNSKAEEDALRLLGLPANCYITKPVDFEAFANAIRSLETFWFEVVTRPRGGGISPSVPSDAERPPVRWPSGDRIRVLVVEDNETDTMLLRASLEKCRAPRFEVVAVASLMEALAVLKTGEFDLVLSDLGLPDCGGLESVSKLLAAAPMVPLLVLTANDDERLGMTAVQEGAQDYLQKGPDQIRTLARTLRLTVERVRLERLLQKSQRLETVGQLAGGIAHDFNNLLTVINGHVGLISDLPGLDGEVRESLDEIGAAVSRAASLTRQLLTFSRQQPVQKRSVDLNVVVGDLHKLLSRLIGEQVRVELQLAARLPSIFADVGMMEQILMNLAVNARDAMERGGKLTIRTETCTIATDEARAHPEAHAGTFVRLTLSDTGAGMSPEVLKRIFEPFFTTKEPGKGTGLGLATVHGVVHQHTGWIEVESQVGRGSRFSVFLPAHAEPVTNVQKATNEVRAVGRGECVLVVEDEEVLRFVLQTTLVRAGYKVLLAGTGPEGLAAWRRADPPVDLVVSDIVMPGGMNGVDLINEMLRHEPGLKHIFVSGYSTEFFRGKSVFVEGDNFLQKPYSLSSLNSLIRTKLDAGPANRESPARKP